IGLVPSRVERFRAVSSLHLVLRFAVFWF
ncbi:hypothetical protein A2U01_0034222, partial [Trifolium medium]|nr:hypothetical protein [Trifolium medium]